MFCRNLFNLKNTLPFLFKPFFFLKNHGIFPKTFFSKKWKLVLPLQLCLFKRDFSFFLKCWKYFHKASYEILQKYVFPNFLFKNVLPRSNFFKKKKERIFWTSKVFRNLSLHKNHGIFLWAQNFFSFKIKTHKCFVEIFST